MRREARVVELREKDPLRREGVKVGGGNLTSGAAEIGEAHVVDKDHDDVGPLRRAGRKGQDEKTDEEEGTLHRRRIASQSFLPGHSNGIPARERDTGFRSDSSPVRGLSHWMVDTRSPGKVRIGRDTPVGR